MAGDVSLLRVIVVTGATGLLVLAGADVEGTARPLLGFDEAEASSVAGGVVAASFSSGIGAQYVLRTCFSAGRRMGLDKKKSMPESIHS
jgi:hypothetical protein